MHRLTYPIAPALTALVALALLPPPAHAAAELPALPAVSPEQGLALVNHAREAMRKFLTDRTPPDKLAPPAGPAAAPLAAMTNAAAVTLRSNGPIVGVGICDEFNLSRNVAAAAQLAMRSPKLPDRITKAVLDGLTIEVEVLSALQNVSEKDVHQVFRPGLTGLAYTQNGSAARMLPSAAYVLDLDAEQVRRTALMSLRPSRAATQPQGLNIFTTRHFLQQPGATTAVELFRGKDLARRQRIEQADFALAAAAVGRFLIRHQANGRYATPDSDGTLREHARAAWAMAQLARVHAADANLPFAASAASAIDYAAGFARLDGGAALLADAKPGDRLAASAMIALAIRDLPRPTQKTWDLRVQLLNGLAKELLAADAAGSATRPSIMPADLYTAYLALTSVQKTEGEFARWLADIRKSLAQFEANWPVEHALAFRSGLTTVPPWQSPKFRFTQLGSGALPDERGAFVLPDQPPSTIETAAAAVCLAKALRASTSAPAEQARLAEQWLEARRFCFMMVYQSGEAYFSPEPAKWSGGVRAAPGSAHVSLGACSAAIEALLETSD